MTYRFHHQTLPPPFSFWTLEPSISEGYQILVQFIFHTGCPQKNYTLFWRAVAPLNFELGIKVGGVLEFSGSQL